MKHLIHALFGALVAVAVVTSATAQTVADSQKVLHIEPTSLRPVQTDALTGVNIDPIQTDMSNRPCARIKTRMNRMTKAEIADVEIKIIGGNAQVIRQMVADDGNGLIFEVTARNNLRFYFQHPEFGESNDVQLAVEGNKEYYLDAWLNQLFSITIATNTSGAEVYIDKELKGRTNDDFIVVAHDVLPGEHTLQLAFEGVSVERRIRVGRDHLYFKEELDLDSAGPQYVVFTVEPANAIVNIEGEIYTPEGGTTMAVLRNGVYRYTVSARGYHSQSGTFKVASEKLEQVVKLQRDAALVTLRTDSEAQIFINGKSVGKGSWQGMLSSGSYIFEAKREGYRTSRLTQDISSNKPQQMFDLPPLEPIYGSVELLSTPLMAEVSIDGEVKGKTPLKVNDIIIGEHTVQFVKEGYNTVTAKVTVHEGEMARLTPTLTTVSATNGAANGSASGTTPSSQEVSIDEKIVNIIRKKGSISFTGKGTGLTTGSGWTAFTIRAAGPKSVTISVRGETGNGVSFTNRPLTMTLSNGRASATQNDLRVARYMSFRATFTLTDTTLEFDASYNTASYVSYSIQGSVQLPDSDKTTKKSPAISSSIDYTTMSLKQITELAEKGDDMAMFQLGEKYYFGRGGVPKDYDKAAKLLRKSADAGNTYAQNRLGYCYRYGHGVEKSEQEAVRWYQKSADGGNAPGKVSLAFCYSKGIGVAQDYNKAFKLYMEAAEDGNTTAYNNLGVCYKYGQGVEKDMVEANRWYRKAADAGYVIAMCNLGNSYLDGLGVPQDYKEAVAWYRKAADKGSPIGYRKLGICYAEGKGVPQDMNIAADWLRKATAKGDKEAKKQLERLHL